MNLSVLIFYNKTESFIKMLQVTAIARHEQMFIQNEKTINV